MTRVVLRSLWSTWKELASYIGDFQARLLLTIFYFTVAAPFAMIVQARDMLRMWKKAHRSEWIPRAAGPVSVDAARRQS